jgi:formyltetrahydrofolate synthetase
MSSKIVAGSGRIETNVNPTIIRWFSMAKMHLSLTCDPKGAPTAFVVPVRDICESVDAGCPCTLLGTVSTMRGLSTPPRHCEIDLYTAAVWIIRWC